MPFAYDRTKIGPAGIQTWKVCPATETEFIELPFIRKAVVTEKSRETPDNRQRNQPYLVEFEAKAEMYATNDLTKFIEMLDTLGTLDMDHQITALNGTTWDTSLLTTKYAGFKWKLMIPGTPDELMTCEIIADRLYTSSQIDTIHGTPTTSVPDTSVLDNLKTLARSAAAPGGIVKMEMGDGSYTDVFEAIRNGSMEFELLCEKDSVGRSKGFAIKGMVDLEVFQYASSDALLINTIMDQQNDYKFTLLNGRVATLTELMGFHFEATHDKDMDGASYIKVHGEGVIKTSEWDGIWT